MKHCRAHIFPHTQSNHGIERSCRCRHAHTWLQTHTDLGHVHLPVREHPEGLLHGRERLRHREGGLDRLC